MSLNSRSKICFLKLSDHQPHKKLMLNMGSSKYPYPTDETEISIVSHPKLNVFFSCAPGSTAILVWARDEWPAIEWKVISDISCELGFFSMAFHSTASCLTAIGVHDTHLTWTFDPSDHKLVLLQDTSGEHLKLKLKGRKRGHSRVNAVGFSMVGRLMVTGGDNNTLVLYSMENQMPYNWIVAGSRKRDVNYDCVLVDVKFSPRRINGQEIVATVGKKGYIHMWNITKGEKKCATPVRVEMYQYKARRPDFVNEIVPQEATLIHDDQPVSSPDSREYNVEVLNLNKQQAPVSNENVADAETISSGATYGEDPSLADGMQDLVPDPVQELVAESVQLHQRHEDELKDIKTKLAECLEEFTTLCDRQRRESGEVISKLKDAATSSAAQVKAIRQETLKIQRMEEKNVNLLCSTILDLCSNKDAGSSGAVEDCSEVATPVHKKRRRIVRE